MKNTPDHQYIIAALSGSSVGGFFMSALHDPLVHQVIGAILMSMAAVLGTMIGNYFKLKFAPKHPVIASVVEQVEKDLEPLRAKYGPEIIARVLVRSVMVSPPVPAEALAPMTGKYPAVQVPTAPKAGE